MILGYYNSQYGTWLHAPTSIGYNPPGSGMCTFCVPERGTDATKK
jgi:hypothetical protein